MTAPKRWYQLSMLQLLVAMTVVAAYVPPNVIAKRVVGNRKSTGFKIDFIRRGWPFTHCIGMEFMNIVDGRDDVSLVQHFDLLKFGGNVAIGTTLMACSVLLAGSFGERKP